MKDSILNARQQIDTRQAEEILMTAKIQVGKVRHLQPITQNNIQFLVLLKQKGWVRRSPRSRGINNTGHPMCQLLG